MGQHVGINAFGISIDDFLDDLIGMGCEMGYALFQPFFDVFVLKAELIAN